METKTPSAFFLKSNRLRLLGGSAVLIFLLGFWAFQEHPHSDEDGMRFAFLFSAAALFVLLGSWAFAQKAQHSEQSADQKQGASLNVGIACALAVIPSLLGAYLFDAPATNDERSYLLQAELFSEGRLTEPLTSFPDAFLRRQVMEARDVGVRYSKYPPATSLAIAPAALLGVPWLATALAGLLDILILSALVKRFRPGVPAVLLFLGMPVFWLVQSSFQSEVFTLPAALLGYYAMLRAREDSRWALLLGLSAGWMFLGRPLTALVFALAMAWPLMKNPRGLVFAVLGGLPAVAFFLFYNDHLTGDMWLTPYAAYAQVFQPLDKFGTGNPIASLSMVLPKALIATGGILGLWVFALAGLRKFTSKDGGAALLFVLLLPVVYAFHWYPGHWAYLGPLYMYETLGLLALGLGISFASLPSLARRTSVLICLLAGLGMAGFHFPILMNESATRALPQTTAAEWIAEGRLPSNAVVLIPDIKHHTPSRPLFSEEGDLLPFPKDAPVFIRPVKALPKCLAEHQLRGRPVFAFQQKGGIGSFRAVQI